jgi:hypothetical protein
MRVGIGTRCIGGPLRSSHSIRFPNEESVQEKQVLQIGIFPNMFKRTKTFTLAG